LTIWKRPYLLTAASAAIVIAQALTPGAGGYAASGNVGTIGHLALVGHTNLAAVAGGSAVAADNTTNELGPQPELAIVKRDPLRHVPASDAPDVAGNAVVAGQVPGFGGGFNGITHWDHRLAGTGAYAGTQFSLEPPDQGLCVSSQFVLETVNDALRVFTRSGQPAAGTVALNQFFGLKPAIIRVPLTFGDFVSDPKCYFDPQTGRFFLTALQIDLNPTTGAFGPRAANLVAVSQTGDPTGTWTIYKMDVSDDGQNGTPSHPGCPCFGDQPLIGADASGFYISTNEYNLFPFGSIFNGAQIYAISKADLASGVAAPTMVQIDTSGEQLPEGGIANSVQPAASATGLIDGANDGTEYFLMSLDFSRVLIIPRHSSPVSSIAVWALTNTGSLNSAQPAVSLSHVVLGTQVYGQPPDAQQKSGELFLGDLAHNPLALIAANDDRMNQVVFADGKLWSAVNTAVQTPNGPTRVGIAYFVVTPSHAGGALSARLSGSGYVTVNQENVLFPSIGVTADGKAVMTLSLVGPDFFPGAAYTTIDLRRGAGNIHIAGAGAGPQDGFTGYPKLAGGNGTARWGDYSAAVADLGGTIWLAQEYIAHPATDRTTRTLFANWATFISSVTP